MTSKHTPGPWLAADRCVYALNAEGVNRFFCGIQPGWTSRGIQNRTPDSELAENTRLIAAATELLEALRDALIVMEASAEVRHGKGWTAVENSPVAKARAAIAKATGAQP